MIMKDNRNQMSRTPIFEYIKRTSGGKEIIILDPKADMMLETESAEDRRKEE